MAEIFRVFARTPLPLMPIKFNMFIFRKKWIKYGELTHRMRIDWAGDNSQRPNRMWIDAPTHRCIRKHLIIYAYRSLDQIRDVAHDNRGPGWIWNVYVISIALVDVIYYGSAQRILHIIYYEHLSLHFNQHSRVLSASTYTHTRAWCFMDCRLTGKCNAGTISVRCSTTRMDAYCGTSIQHYTASFANESIVCACAVSSVCTECNCYHEYYVTIILMPNTALHHSMHRPLWWFGWSSNLRTEWPTDVCGWNVPASFEQSGVNWAPKRCVSSRT